MDTEVKLDLFQDLYQEAVQRINDDAALDEAWMWSFGTVLAHAMQDGDTEVLDAIADKLRRLSAFCYRRANKEGRTEATSESAALLSGLISVADASCTVARPRWLANTYRGKDEAVLLYACQQLDGVSQLTLLHGLEWEPARLERMLYELQAKRLVTHAGIGRSVKWRLTADGEEILRHL